MSCTRRDTVREVTSSCLQRQSVALLLPSAKAAPHSRPAKRVVVCSEMLVGDDAVSADQPFLAVDNTPECCTVD